MRMLLAHACMSAPSPPHLEQRAVHVIGPEAACIAHGPAAGDALRQRQRHQLGPQEHQQQPQLVAQPLPERKAARLALVV